MQNICELNPRMPATRSKQEPAQNTPGGKKAKKPAGTMSKSKINGGTAWIAQDGANGSAVSSRNVLSGRVDPELGGAGSVDASEHSVAKATASSAGDGADRKATADPAEPAAGKRLLAGGAALPSPAETREARQPDGKARAGQKAEGAPLRVPPGAEPLPEDAEAYVDAIHSQVDLVQLEVKLLNSADEKIVQRELACLRELRYGKRAPEAGDEPPEIVFDIPRSQRTQ